MFSDWYRSNKQAFIDFGNSFIALISDKDRIAELADRDLEKVARIFKLIFFGEIGREGTSNEMLSNILEYLKGGGGDDESRSDEESQCDSGL